MATTYVSEFNDSEVTMMYECGDNETMSEESHPRTLYVGNLDASVSEDLVCALFSQIGPVKGCKIIREPHVSLELLDSWSLSITSRDCC